MSSWSELGVCRPSPAASTTLWLSHRLSRQFPAFSPLEGLPPSRSARPGVQCPGPQLSPRGLCASFLGSEVVFQPRTLRRLHRRQRTWSWGDTCSPSSASEQPWQPAQCRDLDSACGEARTHAVPKELVSGLGRSLPGCWVPVPRTRSVTRLLSGGQGPAGLWSPVCFAPSSGAVSHTRIRARPCLQGASVERGENSSSEGSSAPEKPGPSCPGGLAPCFLDKRRRRGWTGACGWGRLGRPWDLWQSVPPAADGADPVQTHRHIRVSQPVSPRIFQSSR